MKHQVVDQWIDAEHTQWVARDTSDLFCEKCEDEVPAFVEVSGWAMGDEPGGYQPLCEACWGKMRQDPFHNPPGARADVYVNLGAAL
jgi:hypothetical protein